MIINEDQQKFLIDNYNKYSVVKLCTLFNERFDTSRSLSSIYNDCNELGLRKKSYHRYTKYEDDFLRENSSNYSGYDLTIIFNDKFGTNILQDTLVMHCYKLGLTVGLDDGKFKKGSNPWDKTDGGREAYISKLKEGLVNSDKWFETTFKKGDEPWSSKPLFTESKRINSEKKYGTWVKTEKGWVLKQNYIWEKENGPIPKNHVVIFADGDKDNFDINNLRCVSNRTFVRIHANKWLNNGNPDFIDTAIIYSDMVNELRPARIKTRKNV